jgi:hypothetical protein
LEGVKLVTFRIDKYAAHFCLSPFLLENEQKLQCLVAKDRLQASGNNVPDAFLASLLALHADLLDNLFGRQGGLVSFTQVVYGRLAVLDRFQGDLKFI